MQRIILHIALQSEYAAKIFVGFLALVFIEQNMHGSMEVRRAPWKQRLNLYFFELQNQHLCWHKFLE